MRGPGTATLLLTTLLSIVGWLMVTLYSTGESLSLDVHKLAIKVNTLEVIMRSDPNDDKENFYLLKESIGNVAREQKYFERLVLRRLDNIDARINTIVITGTKETGEEVVLTYTTE